MKVRLLGVLVLQASLALAQNSQNSTTAATDPATKASSAQVKVDPAKEADIHKLMQLTGVQQLAGQMIQGMEPTMRASLMEAFPPGEYRAQLVDLFLTKLRGKITAAIVDLAVPADDKYFSDDELRQIIAFYETPVGMKTITVMPQLMAEIMANSQELGKQLGRESLAEVLDEHPDLKQAMDQAEQKARKSQ